MNNTKPFMFGTDRRSALAFAFEFWLNVENVAIENNNWTVLISKPENLEGEKPAPKPEAAKVVEPEKTAEPQNPAPVVYKPPARVEAEKPKRDRAAEKAKRSAREEARKQTPEKKDNSSKNQTKVKSEPEPEEDELDHSEPESVEELTAPNDFTEPVKVHHVAPPKKAEPKKQTMKGFSGLASLRSAAKAHH